MTLLPTQMYINTKRNKSTQVVWSTIYTKITSMRKPLGKQCYTYTAAGKGKKKARNTAGELNRASGKPTLFKAIKINRKTCLKNNSKKENQTRTKGHWLLF